MVFYDLTCFIVFLSIRYILDIVWIDPKIDIVLHKTTELWRDVCMVLSDEEKRKRRAEVNRRYREKMKATNPAMVARARRSTKRSQAYNFILKEATRDEVDHMHGLLDKRTEILDIIEGAIKTDNTRKDSDKK